MDKQLVTFKDLGLIGYKTAWDYQESLLQANVKIKSAIAESQLPDNENRGAVRDVSRNVSRLGSMGPGSTITAGSTDGITGEEEPLTTTNYLLLCEHMPVYTLGKSGHEQNILISEAEMTEQGIQFFRTNRGGDITFHGPEQIVGYPIIDLENFYTDIGRYLRELEEVIILTLAGYGIRGERSKGETGVWIEPNIPGRERKICAMGVRCSRWVTMHGFALNVNTDLSYFDNIIPCGIENKQVTSLEQELQHSVDTAEVKEKIQRNFGQVFNVKFVSGN